MAIDYTGTLAKPRLELGAAVMEFVEQEDEFIGTKALPIFGTSDLPPFFVPPLKLEFMFRQTVGA